jgi:hypothetical protein
MIGSKVYVWDSNGNVLPGWPQTVNTPGGSTPVVGDFDGDGKKEIGYFSTVMLGFEPEKSTLYIWRKDGTLLNSNWPKNLPYAYISLSSPTVADFDND